MFLFGGSARVYQGDITVRTDAREQSVTLGPVVLDRAKQAVMAKITENAAAAEALKVTRSPMLAASSSNVPDFEQAKPAAE